MLQTLTERLFDDSEPNDPHAMALATADETGLPDVRMVLLNRRDARGFCFFTNFESDKGRQLLTNPQAAMVMHWKSLRRQVRMRGSVEVVTPEDADAYFASRPRGSQVASSVSLQSRPLASRAQLIAEVDEMGGRVREGDVVRPPHWSGFRLVPTSIEFWKDGEFRLHDRVRFTRTSPADAWASARLYP